MNIKKITSFTSHAPSGVSRLSATYMEVSEDGEIIKDNDRINMVVIDDEIQQHIDAINLFLATKL